MNISLPYPLLPLLCASILASSFALAVTAFLIVVSPALWIVPAVFIVTFAIHAIFILLSNTEQGSTGSLHVFSKPIVVGNFFAAVLWAGVTAVLVLYTVWLFTGHIPSAPSGREWAIITAGAVSLVETALMTAIAVQTHKVRQRLRYREKWRWRPGATSSQWSIAQ
ncbi:hypothetical protein P691DRAFT_760328 [Macrolepiota fuliginosa MF-IS2]|uniref:Uncharacterized protein n=1 Tax=Macrolepiota fuliginosa MF-IS2 TaxID=1400762 RepID=A0A9P5XDQ2_9AGAR|nr:hypothetical protein P691DRAFT_760328 [Macrolepiota fuliginosa MF-IS2]